MITLTIRTDKPEAELGLYKDDNQHTSLSWPAHRQLAETIHQKFNEILGAGNCELKDLTGIVVYKGPGSFTGLRIGISVANALADALSVPIVATTGDDWQENGLQKLQAGQNDKIAMPEYGAEPHITQQKK